MRLAQVSGSSASASTSCRSSMSWRASRIQSAEAVQLDPEVKRLDPEVKRLDPKVRRFAAKDLVSLMRGTYPGNHVKAP